MSGGARLLLVALALAGGTVAAAGAGLARLGGASAAEGGEAVVATVAGVNADLVRHGLARTSRWRPT